MSNNKETVLKREDLQSHIQKECKSLFNKSCKDLGICLIRFDGEKGILRCNHTEKEKTIELIESIKTINGEDLKFKTIATSGTIKSLNKKHM